MHNLGYTRMQYALVSMGFTLTGKQHGNFEAIHVEDKVSSYGLNFNCCMQHEKAWGEHYVSLTRKPFLRPSYMKSPVLKATCAGKAELSLNVASRRTVLL